MEVKHLRDLHQDRKNARKHNPRNVGMIVDALREVGAARSGVIDEDGRILAGNATWEALGEAGIERVKVVEANGEEWVVVKRTGLTEEQKRRLALYDNRAAELAEWDIELLADDIELLDGLWSEGELEELLGDLLSEPEDTVEVAHAKLAERFIVPPFTVLDARQGYWQERKRAWLALGIQSELGRGQDTAPGGSLRPAASLGSDGKTVRGDGRGRRLPENPKFMQKQQAGKANPTSIHNVPGYYYKREAGMADDEIWAEYAQSGLMVSGASIFDPVLCELCYSWFCPSGGLVLDPFAGGSVRGIVASYLGKGYTGVELRPEQVEANRWQGQEIVPDSIPTWIVGNSLDVSEITPGDYDFLFSCPPYYDLEVYSSLDGELSAKATYDEFLADYQVIVAKCLELLRQDRFACFVVGDIRNQAGCYRNFVSDTIAAFRAGGASLYNEAILVQPLGSLPIRVGKQFSAGRKLGKTHQNVLVFVKGDWRKATEVCGPVEVADLDRWHP